MDHKNRDRTMARSGPRTLVLGGGGFIGRRLVENLAARGDEVIVIGRQPRLSPRGSLIQYVAADLESADWSTLCRGVEIIYHCAWSSVPQTAEDDPLGDVQANVLPTLRLLNVLKTESKRRLVFLSSGGTVYGLGEGPLCVEGQQSKPIGFYGAGKLTIETYLRAYHHANHIDARVARISNPYGGGQDLKRRQGLINSLVHAASNGEPITIWGDGEVVRDYIYIDEVADALMLLGDVELSNHEEMPVINVGSGCGVSVNEAIRIIEGVLCRPLAVTRMPGRHFDVKVNVLDITLAEQLLGWSPQINLEKGIRLMMVGNDVLPNS